MRKWIAPCALAAALILIVLLEVVRQFHAPLISVGKPLSPGKVKAQLVNAWDTAVLLAPDGSLWAWGGTELGLMGVFPHPLISQVPLRIGSDSDWSQVAASAKHTVALKNDGSLWGWGWNNFGQIGQTNFTGHYGTPTRIGADTNWTQICVGSGHSLALKKDGSLWAWGDNSEGQLGDGTRSNTSVPTMIGTDRDWRTIKAGSRVSFALKKNGVLWAWGLDCPSSELGPKPIDSGTNWLAISSGDFSMMVLKTDGTLWQTSLDASLKVFPDGGEILSFQKLHGSAFVAATVGFTQIGLESDWADVYAGESSLLARKRDGSWWGWGQNYWGQLGLGTGIKTQPSPQRLPFDFEPWAFAAAKRRTLLLGKDGKLWTWGVRLGVDKPGAARQKFEAIMAPAVKRFPALRFLIKSDIDQTPHLLWELPPEVRRSLGSGPISFTNNLTDGHPGNR